MLERSKSGMRWSWVGRSVAASVLAMLIGCGSSFFPPLTTTTGTGTGTGTSTGDYVYVANEATANVAGFAVTTTTAGVGTLTAVANSPYAMPVIPTAMAITPSNSFLYVAGAGGIYAYTINSTTGALTIANSGGAVAVSTYGAASMDISPDGQWLFALSQDNVTLQEYQITASTGALGVVASPQYTAYSGLTASAKMVKVAPNGAYVFVALGTGGDLVFPFTTATGALGTSYQQYPFGSTTTGDNALTVDSGTTFLYIARSGASSGVAVYSIGSGGALTAVTGSPFAAGGGPFSVMLDSTGKYVYTANRTDSTISGFTIGTGGVLTAIKGSPFASGSTVTSLAIENSAKYVLAAAEGGSSDLTMYSFDATTLGKLDSVATATTGTDPTGAILVVATH